MKWDNTKKFYRPDQAGSTHMNVFDEQVSDAK